MTADASRGETVRRAIVVRGTVQGVGFRPFVYGLAAQLGLGGWVKNLAGEVSIEVEGAPARVEEFLRGLGAGAPRLSRIASIEVRDAPPVGSRTFEIDESEARDGGLRPIPPDAGTCDDCRRELLDPADRRHRYPFVNCTSCGPRYTIVESLPYDRARTSMARFPLCEACRREYLDPRDRRFHAEPVACPACGPELRFVRGASDGSASPSGEAALGAAVRLLREGGILALKGLGGFQLLCDATSQAAVARLRDRKRRPAKPLAVLVATVADARALAHVSGEEEKVLASSERPIVLLRRREDVSSGSTPVAPSVAGGLSTLGLLLPVAPVHELLARDLGRPLVCTSGNLSEDPIAIDDAAAFERLAGVADAFLVHDRAILTRLDDSVVRVAAGTAFAVRRARGLAPRPLDLGRETGAPCVLGVGAHEKSAFALVDGRTAWLGQHVGDLESAATLDAFREALAIYRRLFGLAPRAFARDLHPDFPSSHEAERLAAGEKLPVVAVQHHHAHLVSCLAERGHAGPAVGLCFDGTGLGTDGTIWGGEVLVGDARGFERVGHLTRVRLPGGERAIKRPDRVALAHVRAAAPGDERLAGLAAATLRAAEARVVSRQIETGFLAPWTSSVGRLFDAVAVLLGLGPEARYEGELACLLEALADAAPGASREPLPFPLSGEGTAADPLRLEAGPLVLSLFARRERGEDVRGLARAFHEALAAAASEAAARVAKARGLATVVLTGGCFQNARLLEECRRRLESAGLAVLSHELVPPNDGGLALGQALVAAASLAG